MPPSVKGQKINGAVIRAVIKDADEMLADRKVQKFTSSAYVPVPIGWRGRDVVVLRLKKKAR